MGTKQGDPLSSLLFNTGLQAALEDDLERRREKRFADDVLLFSTPLDQLRSTMSDVKKSAGSVGLKIHPDKTKILSNQGSNKKKR